jgi:hypothetical protein
VEVEEDLMKEEQDSDEDLMEEFDRGQYNGVTKTCLNQTDFTVPSTEPRVNQKPA